MFLFSRLRVVRTTHYIETLGKWYWEKMLLPLPVLIHFNVLQDKLWIPFHEGTSMKVTFRHLDLGIGGAERLVVDSGVALKNADHSVDFITSHHDKSHCFPETKSQLPVTVSRLFVGTVLSFGYVVLLERFYYYSHQKLECKITTPRRWLAIGYRGRSSESSTYFLPFCGCYTYPCTWT